MEKDIVKEKREEEKGEGKNNNQNEERKDNREHSKKDSRRKIGTILLSVLIFFLFFQMWHMGKQIEELEIRSDELYQKFERFNQEIPYLIQQQSENVKRMLEEEASLILDSSVDIRLIKNRLEVTVKAEPKAKKTGETLIVRVEADGKVHEKEMDEQNQVVIQTDLAKTLDITLLFCSEGEVKQEKIKTIQDMDYLNGTLRTNWDYEESEGEEQTILRTWAIRESELLSITEDDIAQAEFIITANPRNEKKEMAAPPPDFVGEEWTKESLEQVQGDRVAAKIISGNGEYRFGFELDFTKYATREDGMEYGVYLTFTTKDGVMFACSQSPIASYRSDRKGMTTESGSGSSFFRPVF